MNTIILIKLIAAHLTGDFILQSDKMCAEKFSNDSSARYKVLILHALIQAAWHTYSPPYGVAGLFRLLSESAIS